jgi:hypothetical protein
MVKMSEDSNHSGIILKAEINVYDHIKRIVKLYHVCVFQNEK